MVANVIFIIIINGSSLIRYYAANWIGLQNNIHCSKECFPSIIIHNSIGSQGQPQYHLVTIDDITIIDYNCNPPQSCLQSKCVYMIFNKAL